MMSFDDVKNQFRSSVNYITFVRKDAFTPLPAKAPWLEAPTLARWFYQGAQEAVKVFDNSIEQFQKENGGSENIDADTSYAIGNLSRILRCPLEGFKLNIAHDFGNNKMVLGALAA